MQARSRRTTRILNGAFVIGIALFALWLFAPVHTGGYPPSSTTLCVSNVKKLTLGLLMYSSDYDDHLPLRDGWLEAAVTYEHPKPDKSSAQPLDRFRCPTIVEGGLPGYGYAFNSLLNRADLDKITKPEETPMIYDSINYGPNASDPVNSLPEPGRHQGRNVIGWADGHTSTRKPGVP